MWPPPLEIHAYGISKFAFLGGLAPWKISSRSGVAGGDNDPRSAYKGDDENTPKNEAVG
jgi:hypothetical protein